MKEQHCKNCHWEHFGATCSYNYVLTNSCRECYPDFMPNPTKTNSEQGRLNKGGDTSERIKTLAWWVKHADTEAEGIKIVEDFLAQQQSLLLDKVKEIVSGNYKGAFIDDGGFECWYVDDLLKSLDSLIDKK